MTRTAAPALNYPDAEAVVANWLATQLAARGEPCPVFYTVPSPRRRRFVVVQRTGGQKDSPVTLSAQITVDCWAPDRPAAYRLADACWQILEAAVGADPFGVVVTRHETVAGPTNYPDPTSNQPRYTFTVLLSFRGTEPSANPAQSA